MFKYITVAQMVSFSKQNAQRKQEAESNKAWTRGAYEYLSSKYGAEEAREMLIRTGHNPKYIY